MSSPRPNSMEQILDRFDGAWNGPTPPSIEAYLPHCEPDQQRLLLVELISIDLERRLAAGEQIRIEEMYLPRFPVLSEDPAVVMTLATREFELRRCREPELSPLEYLERFPQYRNGLLAQMPTLNEHRSSEQQQELVDLNTPVGGEPCNATIYAAGQQQEPNINAPVGGEQPFDPLVGKVLLGRYRIAKKLGEGGMGVVFLAEDLRTNEEAALKFLPRERADDVGWRAQLYQEVRIARTVAHPHVCRVHHIEYLPGGQPFLLMEYIEGENLVEWMKKRGRPLLGEAVKWSRQLCEGLWALHSKGILHRDLKPSNVMLGKNRRSGEIEVRLTDFGLAALAGDVARSQIHWGTPLYQAPEQLAGREVSRKSDLYALGLILYELFTGKQAFPLQTTSGGEAIPMGREEAIRIRDQREFIRPSKYVPELDPRVERVILRCLEPEPWVRPHSIVEVARALPGANPEDLVRFAGETPPPDVAADVGEEGVLPLWLGAALLCAALLCLMGVVFLADDAMLHRKAPPSHSPEFLRDRAQDIITLFHPKAERSAESYIWLTNLRYRHQLDEMNKRDAAGPSPIITFFYYRQSPRYLAATDNRSLSAGIVTAENPPREPGMAGVALDAGGRLLEFYYVPDEPLLKRKPGLSPDEWWKLLEKSGFPGLKKDQYRSVATSVNPRLYCTMESWERQEDGDPKAPKRIEVGLCNDQLVYVRTVRKEDWISPYDFDEQMGAARRPPGSRLFVLALAIAIPLALRNCRCRRADIRGAVRLSLFLFCTALLAALLGINHIGALPEMDLLLANIGSYGVLACLVGVCYLAMEPSVRKRWPARISAWHRVLAGRFWDPLVGRDVLIGCLLGIACLFIRESTIALASLLGRPTDYTSHQCIVVATQYASPAPRYFLLMTPFVGVAFGLFSFFVAFLLYRVFRKPFLSWTVYFVLTILATTLQLHPFNGVYSSSAEELLWTVLSLALSWGGAVYVTIRFGLLASIIASFTHLLLILAPMTSDFSVWYAWRSLLVLVLVCGLAIYACLIALGGPARVFRLIFGEE